MLRSLLHAAALRAARALVLPELLRASRSSSRISWDDFLEQLAYLGDLERRHLDVCDERDEARAERDDAMEAAAERLEALEAAQRTARREAGMLIAQRDAATKRAEEAEARLKDLRVSAARGVR